MMMYGRAEKYKIKYILVFGGFGGFWVSSLGRAGKYKII